MNAALIENRKMKPEIRMLTSDDIMVINHQENVVRGKGRDERK